MPCWILLFILLIICRTEKIPDPEKDTYYELLQIPRDADTKAIKSAYRQLAVRWHPDKNPDNTEFATNIFRALTEAYDCLSNQECRENYDKFGKEGMKNQQQRQNSGDGFGFGFGDIFNFGGRKQKFNMGGDFTFERAEEIFKRVFEDEDGDSGFEGFGGNGFKFKTNFGNTGGDFSTFSSSQTFTTSRSGGGSSQSISTSRIIRNGKTVEVKKVTVTRPDGTTETKVQETVIDNEGKRLTNQKTYQEGKEYLDQEL